VLERDQNDAEGWRFDLSSPAWPRAALLWPGVAFLAWTIIQVVPLPAAIVQTVSPGRGHLRTEELQRPYPFSIDAAASLRGIAFASSMLLMYLAAAALATRSACRRRFRVFIAGLGLVLALVALFQIAVGARRIYGVFTPIESESFFGVFVNRNHFAAYMTLCAMAALAILHRSFHSYRHRLGPGSNRRRQILALGDPEGVRLILAAIPVPITIGALIATTSRGGILAFGGALLLAAAAIRGHRRRLPAGIVAFLVVGLPLLWFGFERLEDRFGQIAADESGRTAVWRQSLESMSGTWLTGAGLNTFPDAISRVLPLRLPVGAAAWPAEVAEAIPAQLRIGHRTPERLEGWIWYREAHNDYVQLAVETGAIGAAIGLWGLLMLAARLREPWLASGVIGILAHSTVDFSLQIPAVAILFFVVCAYAERTSIRRPVALPRPAAAAPMSSHSEAPAAAYR